MFRRKARITCFKVVSKSLLCLGSPKSNLHLCYQNLCCGSFIAFVKLLGCMNSAHNFQQSVLVAWRPILRRLTPIDFNNNSFCLVNVPGLASIVNSALLAISIQSCKVFNMLSS